MISSDYLVQDLLRWRSVNLVGGPVGAGKSTLIFQLAQACAAGVPFLGFQTQRIRIAYVPLDRDRVETLETLNRLHVPLGSLDIFPIDEIPNVHLALPTLESLISKYCSTYPLVIVEPLDYLLRDPQGRTGNPNDKMQVFQFLLKARKTLAAHQSVLLGSMHTTKFHNDSSRAVITRERIAGTTAWTANCSTVILVDPVEPGDDTNPFRTVTFLLRNAPNLVLDARLDEGSGRLDLVVVPDRYLTVYDEILKATLGTEFTTTHLKRWADSAKVHPRSLRRYLDYLIGRGLLRDGGYGSWFKSKPM